MKRLPRSFTDRDATAVAPDLLNKILIIDGRKARISETEAYASDDPASHSFRGRTARTAVMFGPSGRLYVYLIYGMHLCVNVVAGGVDDAQAVLLRAALIHGVDPRRSSGPGRLTRELGVQLSMNGLVAQLFDDGTPPPADPWVGPRVGITRAVDRPWRWKLPDA